jgi:3-oxoacyl-[acyl-carrier protein] reductase
MVATQLQQTSNTSQLLHDRVVLITRASRGIGAATAKLLGQHGAAVGVNYYGSEAAAVEVVELITSDGGRAMAVKANVRDPQQVDAMSKIVSNWLKYTDKTVKA